MADTFAKTRPTAPDAYPAEAAGLTWLAAAGPGAARIVEVLEVSPDRLVLPRLVPAQPTRAGRARTSARRWPPPTPPVRTAFGAPPDGWTGDGYIGTQPLLPPPHRALGLPSTPTSGCCRTPRPPAAIGNLSPRGRDLVDRVAERLRAGEFDDDRPPARIHGDLWAGNVIFTATGVVLIDPAAHGGHGLTDLAMLHLFGAPELRTITDAYADAAALPADWTELIGLHQLHPLLVHAVTHGAELRRRGGGGRGALRLSGVATATRRRRPAPRSTPPAARWPAARRRRRAGAPPSTPRLTVTRIPAETKSSTALSGSLSQPSSPVARDSDRRNASAPTYRRRVERAAPPAGSGRTRRSCPVGAATARRR